MQIGIVKTAKIYVSENWQLSCELELLVKGVHYQFRSEALFIERTALPNDESGSYFSRFLSRCMEICDVTDYNHLPHSKVLVTITEKSAVAISSLDGRKSFNPREEFERLPAYSLIS
jgi:hypothetical protein